MEEGLAWETEGEEESVEKAEKDIGLLGSASRKLVNGMGRPSGLPCRTKTYEDKVHKFSTKPSAIKQWHNNILDDTNQLFIRGKTHTSDTREIQ